MKALFQAKEKDKEKKKDKRMRSNCLQNQRLKTFPAAELKAEEKDGKRSSSSGKPAPPPAPEPMPDEKTLNTMFSQLLVRPQCLDRL